jgi:hypothetical protein
MPARPVGVAVGDLLGRSGTYLQHGAAELDLLAGERMAAVDVISVPVTSRRNAIG